MSNKNSTEAERQRGPCAEPFVVGGMSSLMRAELEKLSPELRAKYEAHLEKVSKGGK
jgi:hypothetical protein